MYLCVENVGCHLWCIESFLQMNFLGENVSFFHILLIKLFGKFLSRRELFGGVVVQQQNQTAAPFEDEGKMLRMIDDDHMRAVVCNKSYIYPSELYIYIQEEMLRGRCACLQQGKCM